MFESDWWGLSYAGERVLWTVSLVNLKTLKKNSQQPLIYAYPVIQTALPCMICALYFKDTVRYHETNNKVDVNRQV